MARPRVEAAPLAGEPFPDEAAYLEAQLERLRLIVERALAVAAGKDGEEQRAAAEELRRRIAARVQASEAAGVAIGLEQLRRRFALDDEDVDILVHVAAASLDPQLGKLHTRLSGAPFHPWLDVGIAIVVHHDGVGERLRARARFQAGASLIKHRLISLDRARPEARDNLLACELKLPPRVARIALGSDPSGGAINFSRLVDPEIDLDQVILADDIRLELDQLVASQPKLSARLAAWGYDALIPQGRAVTLLFCGPPGTGKTTLATALAKRLGKRLLVVDGSRLMEAGRTLEAELDELFLEARAAGCGDAVRRMRAVVRRPRRRQLAHRHAPTRARSVRRSGGAGDQSAGKTRRGAGSARALAAAARRAAARPARKNLAHAAAALGAAGRRRRPEPARQALRFFGRLHQERGAVRGGQGDRARRQPQAADERPRRLGAGAAAR